MPFPLRFYYFSISLGVTLLLPGPCVQAQEVSYGELQAAYLYNFAKYIKWPTTIDVFVIGVFAEESAMMQILENTLKGKRIGGKPVFLKKIVSVEESLD